MIAPDTGVENSVNFYCLLGIFLVDISRHVHSKLTGQECISLVTVATNNLITSGGLQSRDVAQLSREV